MGEPSATDVIEPRQKWEVDFFRPEDAPGVARLFCMVYGNEYPVKTFTDPQLLIEENAAKRVISSVARTPKGDIIGHIALYRSAPFQGIYESGAGLVAPNYRGGVIYFRLMEHSITVAVPGLGIETAFGEPVCNHVVAQKCGLKLGSGPCAVEVDLMPAETYTKEESASGRVATLLTFKVFTAKPQTIYLPAAYEEMARFLYEAVNHESRFILSSEELPAGVKTRVETQVFEFAKVARFTVHDAGDDFASAFEEREKAAAQKGAVVYQVWLKLSWPWVGRVAGLLRARGYFAGGILPRWFDVDGFLMQKAIGAPNWEGIQVFGDRAEKMLAMVRQDWEATRKEADHG